MAAGAWGSMASLAGFTCPVPVLAATKPRLSPRGESRGHEAGRVARFRACRWRAGRVAPPHPDRLCSRWWTSPRSRSWDTPGFDRRAGAAAAPRAGTRIRPAGGAVRSPIADDLRCVNMRSQAGAIVDAATRRTGGMHQRSRGNWTDIRHGLPCVVAAPWVVALDSTKSILTICASRIRSMWHCPVPTPNGRALRQSPRSSMKQGSTLRRTTCSWRWACSAMSAGARATSGSGSGWQTPCCGWTTCRPRRTCSGFTFGVPGCGSAVANVRTIVQCSLQQVSTRAHASPRPLPPWRQAFKDCAFDRRDSGAAGIRGQIRAAEEAGTDAWVSWNPGSAYSARGIDP